MSGVQWYESTRRNIGNATHHGVRLGASDFILF